MADSFGIKLGVEGEKEFKSALSDINRSFKVLGSEMKLVQSQFGKNDSSVEGLTARNEVLNRQIEKQKEKIATLKSALDNASSSFGENDRRTQNWQIQLNNAEASLNSMEREVKENNKALENAEGNLEDATKNADKFAEKIDVVGDESAETKGKLSKLGSSVKAVGVALGATMAAIGTAAVAAGKKMWSLANDVAQSGDKIDKTSQKIGISAESYQKWGYVFERCGANVDGLQGGMKKLSSVITDAAKGSDSAVEKLSAVGLSIDDLNGKSQDEQLSIVVSALQNMKSGAERTSAANKLLGKSATDMGAVLNLTAEETNALNQEAEEYGMVMSNDAVSASAKFQDSLTKMKGTLNGLKNSMVGELLPGITQITDGFSDLVAGNKGASEEIKSGVTSVIETVSQMIPQAVELIGTIAEAILESAPLIITSLAEGILEAIPQLATVATGVIQQLIQTLFSLLPQIMTVGMQVLVSLMEGISQSLPELIPQIVLVVTEMINAFVSNLSSFIDAGVQVVLALIEGLIEAIPILIEQIPVILESLINALMESLPMIIEGITELINSVVEALPDIISAIVEMLPQIIEMVVSAITELLPVILQGVVAIITGIVEALPELITMLVDALPDLITTIIDALVNLLPTIIEAILDCLPTIIEGAIKLILGIVKALPKIIKSLISALPKIITSVVKAIIKCLPQLINGAIELIVQLVTHLPEIILGLIEALPSVIAAIVDGLLNALPQLIEGCITLVVELVKNMPKIILGLIKAVPKIIASLVKAFGKGVGKFVEIGGNLIKGIWKGISDCASWIWDKISGFFGGIVDGIKDFFGINSPSKLFRDQIGKNLALGLGEGFERTMESVGKDMQQAIPTDFDTQVQATANVNSFTNGNDNSFLGRAIQTFNNTVNFGEVHINSEMDIDDVAHRVSSVIVSDILVKGGAYT